jgi:hypothetical protein
MTQYRVLASEGRQRYIYTKTPKNIEEKKKKFPDSLPLVILHFSGNIINGSLCIEVPWISHSRFSPLHFDNCLYLRSLQFFVTIDLIDNFLKLLKAFSDCGKQFSEIADFSYDSKLQAVRRER